MAFCSKCGTQLADGAKFCPNCGEQVNQQSKPNEQPKKVGDSSIKEGWQEGVAESKKKSNHQAKEESLSTWEKIALGVAVFVAFTGIVGGFADGMWIVGILSLCAMGVVCAVFMGLIEKKYAWTSAIVSSLVVLCAIGASAPDEEAKKEKQAQTEMKQETLEEKQAREKKEQAEQQEREQQEKLDRIESVAERESRILAQSVRYTESWPKHCQSSYISAFGAPSSSEDFKMYEIFKEAFRKNYFATLDALQKMN